MKFKEYNQDQLWLIPPNIEDEIPEHDICRVINDIVDLIDTSSIEGKFKEEGNTAYHPKMMLKSLYYSYSQGIFSSRKIAKEHERNIYYWYLSGKQRPDFRTINYFRNKHINELKTLFYEISKLCVKLGMVEFKTAAIDGTKIRANASRDKFRSEEWLDKIITKLNTKIDELFEEAKKVDKEEDKLLGEDNRGDEIPEEIANEKKRREKLKKLNEELKKKELKKINETDTEARLMKSQGKYWPAYNCQAVVDEKNQVIVSANVIDDGHDFYQMPPLLEEVKNEYLEKPAVVLGDTGYCDGVNISYLHNEKIDGYIPDKMAKHIKAEIDGKLPEGMKYKKDQFKYNKEKDVYICPEGEILPKASKKMTKATRVNGEDTRFHTYQCYNKNCSIGSKCHKAKNGRKIYRYEDQELRDEMAKKIRTEEGFEIYKDRMKIVEPVFGNIKFNFGFSQFSLRGLIKTRGEFFIAACVHNLQKIKSFMIQNKILDLKTVLNEEV